MFGLGIGALAIDFGIGVGLLENDLLDTAAGTEYQVALAGLDQAVQDLRLNLQISRIVVFAGL